MKCPKCGEPLEHLDSFSLEENRQTIHLDDGEELDWSSIEPVEGTTVYISFECPSCNMEIYRNKGDSCDPKIKEFLVDS
jgi:predicted RNA-binding Zn-ribbon protein involved in translation (DUF1610 family)